MQSVLDITLRVTLPSVGFGTALAIFALPSGIISGPVTPWIPLLWASCAMMTAGGIAWLTSQNR